MKKILIIEDDEIVGPVYRNKLSNEGYLVQLAVDGEEGYEKVKNFQPDLVILDLIIPKLPGVELMKKLRAEPAYEKLPIVVFSNTYLSNIMKDAWKAGATKCLSKSSCTPKQVIEALRGILADDHSPESSETPTASSGGSKAGAVKGEGGELSGQAKAFLEKLPTQVAALRDNLKAVIKNHDDAMRTAKLDGMFSIAHSLTGAGAVNLSVIAQFGDAFEALLKELRDRPQTITPSTLRTLATAVDFLETLSRKAGALESTKSIPTRILVVDDELLSRRAVTHALDRAKLQSTDIEDPLTALKMLEETAYDLVFLDADMPGMNGFELCAKLRMFPLHRKTPVVFVTALNDFEARANSAMAGANDFIAKPFPFVELAVKALIYVLRGRLDAKR